MGWCPDAAPGDTIVGGAGFDSSPPAYRLADGNTPLVASKAATLSERIQMFLRTSTYVCVMGGSVGSHQSGLEGFLL